jgi:hypothetical protein
MLRATQIAHRKRSAWRELLHPLSTRARRAQWDKRDLTERNEAMLRRPFYTFAAHSAATEADAADFMKDSAQSQIAIGPQLEAIDKRAAAFAPGNAAKLSPNYPQSAETLPPQNTLRTVSRGN